MLNICLSISSQFMPSLVHWRTRSKVNRNRFEKTDISWKISTEIRLEKNWDVLDSGSAWARLVRGSQNTWSWKYNLQYKFASNSVNWCIKLGVNLIRKFNIHSFWMKQSIRLKEWLEKDLAGLFGSRGRGWRRAFHIPLEGTESFWGHCNRDYQSGAQVVIKNSRSICEYLQKKKKMFNRD